MIEIPDIKGKDLFDFLIENKSTLIAQKKFEPKRGDGFCFSSSFENNKGRTIKANTPISQDRDSITVSSIINTTYWFDSHKDVHIDGIWKRSLSQPRQLYLLQEHSLSFKGIISDEVTAYTKKIAWRKFGIEVDGYTEALVFDSVIKKSRNEYMFGEYAQGHVKNHSVGMQYVSMDLAINDEDYPAYHELWNKYIDKIANQDEVKEAGYFWPIFEAKAIEGSAVPIGSNIVTPTQSVKHTGSSDDTRSEPSKDTRVLEGLNNLLSLTKQVK